MSLSPTNQPTNQPTGQSVPTFYVSIRLTQDHDQWQTIKDKILSGSQYVVYLHKGSGGDNPHFHIFVPDTDQSKKATERYRKRIKTAFPDCSGNAYFSCQFKSNGILNAITYGSKEDTVPYVSDPDMQSLVDLAPPWVHQDKNIGGYMKKPAGREPHPDHFKLITPRNIEKVCLRYRQHNGIRSKNLEDTLEAMHRDNWRLAEPFLRNGIMKSYFDSFTSSCNGEHHWTKGKFLYLARPDFHHTH